LCTLLTMSPNAYTGIGPYIAFPVGYKQSP